MTPPTPATALPDVWEASAAAIMERAMMGDPAVAMAQAKVLRACAAAVRAALAAEPREPDAYWIDERHGELPNDPKWAEPPALDVERLAEAMASCDGVKWPVRWTRNESHDFSWVARQVAAEYARLTEAER